MEQKEINEAPVEVEQTAFHSENVWFYQIPRHASTSDPRADAWNPDKPLLTGSAKVILKGDSCFIRLFEPLPDPSPEGKEPVLFAQCPLVINDQQPLLSIFVQDCADSSRYFVIRVQDDKSKRHAYVGIGFPERAAAFNFKAALQDYVRYRTRQIEASRRQHVLDEQGDGRGVAGSPVHSDKFQLKEGQKIHISIKGAESTGCSLRARQTATSDGTSKLTPLAPPPPPPGPAGISLPAKQKPSGNEDPAQSSMREGSAVDDMEEDWGEFESA